MKTPTLETDTHETKVVFRKWPKSQGGGIIALFPQIPASYSGHMCESYEHLGQHGGADPRIVRSTHPATPEESAPLRRELESIGYRLREGKKITAKDDRLRCQGATR